MSLVQLQLLHNYFYYDWKASWLYKADKSYLWAVFFWFVEWCFFIGYLFTEWWRVHLFIPMRVPTMLVVCIFFWTFTWGLSIWRRTQYGRFTRGEKKLWAKALAAFWVAEFVTIGSLLIAYCWMNWGPLPLVPRRLIFPRRGLIFEFIVYSYIIFLAYLTKLGAGWGDWQLQMSSCFFILFVFSLLLWRDALCLLFRDPMDIWYGVRWKNVRLTAVVYTLEHDWWVRHMLGRRGGYSHYPELLWSFSKKTFPITWPDNLTEYEQRHWLSPTDVEKRRFKNTWSSGRRRKKFYVFWNLLNQGYYYPRRTGFIPKRLTMWQFLTFLKMFHHLVVLLWWVLFTYRVSATKKTSFSFLASCHFNTYCCFILALMVYFIYYALYWEMFFKLRPGVFTPHKFTLMVSNCWYYFKVGFIFIKSQYHVRESLFLEWW